MIISFVDPPRRSPEWGRPENSMPSKWTIVFMGCLLINTVTFSFIPMSQISNLDVSILFLVLVVLPLLFLSLFLATKFGYALIFAAFLSIPGGFVSVIFLGDFFSILMGRNIVEDIQVREATFYPMAKVYTFRQPILDLAKTIQSSQGNSSSEIPIARKSTSQFQYSLVPILDSDHREGEEVSAFAVCTQSLETTRECEFNEINVRGGFQVSENLRMILKNIVRENEDRLNLYVKSSPIFLFWVADPREKILNAGWYGLAFIIFLNLFWIGSVYFYYSIQKKF